MKNVRTQICFIISALAVFLCSTSILLSSTTKWTESATLKTKRIYDDSGKLIYEENFNKKTGLRVGPVFDERPKADSRRPGRGDLIVAEYKGRIYLKPDSLIQVKMGRTLDSRSERKGNTFPFTVVRDYYYGGRKLISAGTRGTGVVTRVVRRGRFGRPGQIHCNFRYIQTVGGHRIPLDLTKKARERNDAEGYAAGASMFGLAALGPVGLVGGLFVKGRDVKIPKGSLLFLGVCDKQDITGEIKSRR